MQNVEYYKSGTLDVFQYLNNEAKLFKTSKNEIRTHKDELRSGNLLNTIGIDTIYRKDWFEKDGQTFGLTDCLYGIEIKTLDNTTSINTVGSHISNFKHKYGEKSLLLLDFSKNSYLKDDVIAEMVKKKLTNKNVDFAFVAFPSKDKLVINQ